LNKIISKNKEHNLKSIGIKFVSVNLNGLAKIPNRLVQYDKYGTNHFDTASAFIKSIRGSDPNAALYYFINIINIINKNITKLKTE